ncbi:DmpA family aminopeptidase [Clostridium sp. Marseille-QA1073]
MGIRRYGITIGELKTGKNNLITDVEGVKVGHVTLNKDRIKTGVTAILPHEGNIFKEKVMASYHVINGFGKTIGTIQIEELGNIETPILLTNTLSVGSVSEGLIKYMLSNNADIGDTTGTINPVVCECNDGYLNDIRQLAIKSNHALEAIKNADIIFEEGAVGAGTGMSCYGLKGGIGSSSRIIELGNKQYTLGVLVLSNFGRKKDLIINHREIGKEICDLEEMEQIDKGSIIIIIATDIPLNERQLKRVSKRAVVGLARTGSYVGNGSGDVVISFTTANKINHYEEKLITSFGAINEEKMDLVFRAAAEAVEESVLNSMVYAETTEGRDGHKRISIKDYLR